MQKIYFDHSATTYVDKRVLDKMLPYFSEIYGNGSSLHSFGQEAKSAIDSSRKIIANCLNVNANEIYFTAGGTESDNWAIKGYAKANKIKGNHIITTVVEHPAVLQTCKQLENEGFEVTYLPVDSEGFVTVQQVKEAIRDNTILVSIMFVNNEIGTIMPIKEIGEFLKSKRITFHTDAVQAPGVVKLDPKELNVDMMSFSGHKFYAPKGIGILYKRNGIRLQSLMSGGEQERGLRAGTLNTTGIVGIAHAMQLVFDEYDKNFEHVKKIRDHFLDRVFNEIKGVKLNGPQRDKFDRRSNNNANLSFDCIEGEAILLRLDLEGIAVSSGSACSSGSLEPSHVLMATGMPVELAHGSIRFSFGKSNTIQEIDRAVDILKKVVESLRVLSPIKMKEAK